MIWRRLTQPPWRTIVPACFLLLCVVFGYCLWTPGKDIRDGRHDRRQNGIWIGHGWLGADEWFAKNNKSEQINSFRNPENIAALAKKLSAHHITDVFPHLCPAGEDGSLPPVDPVQAERFLDGLKEFRVMPWIGGVNGVSARYFSEAWRERFVADVACLLSDHPRFAGVHVNIEPLPSGDKAFLLFLEQLRAVLPEGKILSIAAYPPPTRWHPFPDVHWEEPYFREVARRCDQIAVMMYDTSLREQKLYQRLMADWTEEVAEWSEGRPFLLGVPTYNDSNTEYHRPDVENLRNALLGIHRGLTRHEVPTNYQGIVIYCEWETDENEWREFRELFLAK